MNCYSSRLSSWVMPQEPFDNSLTQSDYLNEFKVAFGKVIAIREAEFGLKQRAFARHADIDNDHLREIESGQRNITVKTLVKLAIALGTTPSTLIKETEDRIGWH